MTNAEFSSIVEAYDDYFMSLYKNLHDPPRPDELPRQHLQRSTLDRLQHCSRTLV
jgi:hypothetical protein